MALDYTHGCVNFRDVGEWINLITGKDLLPLKRIYRGGKLNFITSPEEIGYAGTIINVRKGPDPEACLFGADYFHFSISNDHEKYKTSDPTVRRWLKSILQALTEEINRYPILIHCTSGKDRTGVAVAAILKALGNIEDEAIIEEYLLSAGEVARHWIEEALSGMEDPESYFAPVDLSLVRTKVLGLEG